MNKPFFSVIIPAYNSEAFIQHGIMSVLHQDFKDYELIIVCDSCTDGTAEMAREFTDKVACTDFHSAGSARNTGIDMARGEWVLFLDDDDWFLPGAFRKIAEETEKGPADIIAFGFEWKGFGIRLQSATRIYPAVWNKAWRREVLRKARFPGWAHTEDLAFTRRIQRMDPPAVWRFLEEWLYYYNFLRPGSISARIKNGELGCDMIPAGEYNKAAKDYEKWLRSLKP